MEQQVKIVKLSEVIALTKLSKTSIYERVKDGLITPPFSLGGRSAGYYEHEISMDLMDASDPVEMSLATLHEPTSIINRTVWKSFDNILHHGKITNYDYDQKTGDAIWRIEYGDLDCEDLNWQEVYPILVDTKICCIPPPPLPPPEMARNA